MKKILAIVLMTMLLVTPVFASGEATAEAPAAEAATAVAASVAEPECNHAFTVEVTAEATCTEKGLLTYACSKCGLTYTVETLPTGHAPSAVAATCDQDVVCLNCGEVMEAAIGHAYEYQYDAVTAEDGSYVSYGTWACTNCGDVIDATEGNAVYYAQETAAATSGEAASAEVSEETAAEAAVEVANPNYDPDGYNWASICLTLAIIIVVVGAVLMLSFGKKKKVG